MDAQEIVGWATLIIAIVSVVNAATDHWATLEGTWVKRLLRTLLWVTERCSILASRDSNKVLKFPLTSKPRDAGFSAVEAVFALFVALFLVVALSGGCASAMKTIQTSQIVAEGANGIASVMCDPVRAACKERDEVPCQALRHCLEAKVVTYKSLKSLNGALQLAAMASAAEQDDEADRWLKLATEAMAEAQRQISTWIGGAR